MIEEIKVEEMTKYGKEKVTEETHPAFASIELRRIQGHASLYDSDFRHQAYIELAISTSKRQRGLSRFWHHSEKEITTVALSEAQWATLVSSVGMGGGVPCTLMRREGQMVPQLPEPTGQSALFAREAGGQLQEAMRRLAEIQKEVDSLRLSAKAKDSLNRKLEGVASSIGSNLHFVAKQFGSYMEKTTEKAKAEITAFFSSRHSASAGQLDKPCMPVDLVGFKEEDAQ